MKTLKIVFFLSFTIILSSCATMSDVLQSKDEGTVNVYNVNKEAAWEIAVTVLRWEGCETIEQHKNSNYMLTTVGANFVSEGSLVGVWVEPENENSTKITVVTKRKVQTNLATGLTEATFHESFAKGVDIYKKGEPLPIEKPPYD